MAVAINLGSFSDISDYNSLVDKIKLWLDRGSDLDAYIPTFITLAEKHLNRELRTLEMEAAVMPVLIDGSFPLPADFLHVRGLTVGGRPLPGMSPASLAAYRSWSAGYARGYAIANGSVTIAPADTGVLILNYWQRISALTPAATVNWLLTAHPDIYLYGALAQAEAYIENPDRAAQWASLFQGAIDQLNLTARSASYGGPLAMRSPVAQTWGGRA
jgi:hypothetical protein